ncbi:MULTISPECIES: hypothetical protein [unclassified Alistipes]|uniref:hypothetical protein n=1 Tax=unclassified Alistipes TaxID=2608932 RepID=UPI00258D5652|nr:MULTISPECIES: hypothetical protein [unclassified Alistipes]HUN14951.1 hypothetical protein [Alistipes sp.]
MTTIQINVSGLTVRVVEENEDYFIVEAPLDSLDKELRPFALRVSPTIADKLFRRSERIYINKQAFLLWMNSKDEFAEFQRQNTSQSGETIIEIEL